MKCLCPACSTSVTVIYPAALDPNYSEGPALAITPDHRGDDLHF